MRSIDLGHALDGLYEAAVTPEAWSLALHRFARATGSVGCRLRPVRWRQSDSPFPASPDIAGFLREFVSEGWLTADLRTLRGPPLVEAGQSVILEHDVTTVEERRHSAFYQTLLRRHDLPWWAATAFAVDGRQWCLSILRSSRQGAFTPADGRLLTDAASHLGRAASLASKLSFAQGLGAVEALERLGRAAFVVDSGGVIVTANTLADQHASGDLLVVRGRLHAADPASDRRLQALITQAVSRRTPGTAPPQPLFVARRAGRPHMVEALPATGPMRDVFGRIGALVVVTDLDAPPQLPDSMICEAFCLTAAQGRLASILVGGEDLRKAADCLGITYETARAHLKAIFSKTQVSRQAELTTLLARMAR